MILNYPSTVSAGNTITISWTQERNTTYSIRRQVNLATANWQNINTPILNSYSETAQASWYQVKYHVSGMDNNGFLDSGETGWITVTGGTPPPEPPPTPTLTVPTQVEHGDTFTVSWGTYLIGTTFEVGRSVNGGSYSTLSTAQTGASYSDTALSSWTSVKYRVKATKGSETSGYGYSIDIPVVVPVPKPTVPTISMPSSITANTGFTLSWSGGNGGTFYIDRSINGGAYSVVLENTSSTSKTETPTSSWLNVKYRIRAFLNGYFSDFAYTNTISVKAQTPTVSTSPRIMHRNNFTVSWSNATTGSVYTVERSVNGGSYSTLLTNTTTKSRTETPLDTWTSVRYRVTANHGGANSDVGYSPTMPVDLFFPKLKVMQGGGVKTGIAGWVMVDGTVRRIKEMWVMVDGVLKKLQ